MKKITLLLLLPFAAVLSVWSQSTFTIFPKFQVGDTLVYDAVDNTNATIQKSDARINSEPPKVLFNCERKGQ